MTVFLRGSFATFGSARTPSYQEPMAQLIEILLPLKDASGEDFPAAYYDDLAKELVANFGGVTSFLRAPAEGRWHERARPSTTKSLSSR